MYNISQILSQLVLCYFWNKMFYGNIQFQYNFLRKQKKNVLLQEIYLNNDPLKIRLLASALLHKTKKEKIFSSEKSQIQHSRNIALINFTEPIAIGKWLNM